MTPPDTRLADLLDWLRTDLAHLVEHIEPASSDASFRRYFRARSGGETCIAMDAPPPREDVRPFLAVAELLRAAGVAAPAIHAADTARGFLLLEDFGSRSYLEALTENTVDRLYGDALAALLRLQTGVDPGTCGLPDYDEALLLRELEIFREWFLGELLGLVLQPSESAMLANAWRRLVDSALEQPRVCVHRDFHSRNLMAMERRSPGVLDFQDAVVGPVTYDLVSLLRDCYIAWPAEQVSAWMEGYRDSLRAAGLLDPADMARFPRWFDLMGMQRHLKATGIFSRLTLRDGKSGYLKDIPRTLGYVMEAGRSHPEFGGLLSFLDLRVLPRLEGVLP